MGRKIFVSYKHNDTAVATIDGYQTTARDYVDVLERCFKGDHIYKEERDGDDFSAFKDETIASHLRGKIFGSSLTIVLISKGMKDTYVSESNQWIPWEISYSLKEMSRGGRTSTPNAMLAVVLPNESGRYDYFIQKSCSCGCCSYRTKFLFKILRRNMFNLKNPELENCHLCGTTIHRDQYHSYVHVVTWGAFISKPNFYIEIALEIKEDSNSYNITKEVT